MSGLEITQNGRKVHIDEQEKSVAGLRILVPFVERSGVSHVLRRAAVIFLLLMRIHRNLLRSRAAETASFLTPSDSI